MLSFHIERKRAERLAKFFFNTGQVRKENRGGCHVNEDDIAQTNSIINHIKSLQCRESHYGRGKSVRKYLPPELNVHQLWILWETLS